MIRRPSFLVATTLALLLVLVAVVPAAGYGFANQYHLRLYRLDAISCGTPITLKAELVNVRSPRGKPAHYRGHWVSRPVAGAAVDFSIANGAPGDSVSPGSAVTDSRGRAYVEVTLDCSRRVHQVVASASDYKAAARITLVTSGPRAQYGPWLLVSGALPLLPSHSLYSSLFGPFATTALN